MLNRSSPLTKPATGTGPARTQSVRVMRGEKAFALACAAFQAVATCVALEFPSLRYDGKLDMAAIWTRGLVLRAAGRLSRATSDILDGWPNRRTWEVMDEAVTWDLSQAMQYTPSVVNDAAREAAWCTIEAWESYAQGRKPGY